MSTGNLFVGESKGNVVYASSQFKNVGELDHKPTTGLKGNTETFKVESAYEMAQITATILSAPTTNVEKFKVEFAYATAQVTAKVMPIIPSDQKNKFAYEMAQITTKIVSDQNLDIEKAKVEFAYEMAQITTKIITDADQFVTGKRTTLLRSHANIEQKPVDKVDNTSTEPKARLLRNNADVEPKSASKVDNTDIEPKVRLLRNNADIALKAARKVDNTDNEPKVRLLRNNADIEPKSAGKVDNADTHLTAILNPGYIDPETYRGLIDELMRVGERSNTLDNKVNVDGEIRYHYAFNRSTEGGDRDSSGIRTYLGVDTGITKDWRAYGMLEGQKSLLNYNNEFKLSRLYVAGKVGTSMVRAGSFGYLMAEGNIYDSGFTGLRVDFGKRLKYTLSYGETDYTKKTYIATARHKDFDYNLEAGVYHYQLSDGVHNRNTIWNVGGNYNFSNFGVGAMFLGSSLKDSQGRSNGYVLSFNYGELKTYRPGTYDLFAKYYNQPVGTYIAHGMNGIGSLMQGFKGYGVGAHYTFAKNFVGGIEYYNLTDKISGKKGKTWWSQLSWYF